MELTRQLSFENRYLRHGVFWLAWVTGFTFVKSFGSGWEAYAGWLFYYLATLPVFMLHTYLVVYWAARKFLSGVKIILFLLVFLLLMLLFSFMEMFVTQEYFSRLFPTVFFGNYDYLDSLNIMISGIGNLYIILVFAATRMIRSWYLSDRKGQQLVQKRLFMERADANAGIQPGMLLFSVREIEQLGKESPDEVAGAIAMLSELMNAVMQAHKNNMLQLDEEMRNVRNLIKLYAMLMMKEMPVLKIEQCNTHITTLPAFIVFSPLEIVLRQNQWMPDDSIEVCISRQNQVSIKWRNGATEKCSPDAAEIARELDILYPGRYQVRIETEPQNTTLWISQDPAWSAESHTLTLRSDIVAG